jgi:uncharacterized membrane protein YtjA (UPF0391 family)
MAYECTHRWHAACKMIGMLYYAIIFFVVALVAAALGFWVVTGVAMTIAKILCLVFVVLAILSFFRGRSPRL